jgi:hypothetical protein
LIRNILLDQTISQQRVDMQFHNQFERCIEIHQQ